MKIHAMISNKFKKVVYGLLGIVGIMLLSSAVNADNCGCHKCDTGFCQCWWNEGMSKCQSSVDELCNCLGCEDFAGTCKHCDKHDRCADHCSRLSPIQCKEAQARTKQIKPSKADRINTVVPSH